MKPFRITNPEKMKSILQTFASLDAIRWSYSPNYNLINYCDPVLTADEKILTHWLCYITDRQMPFMRIWNIGGYVLSHLVRAYSRSSDEVLGLVAGYVMSVQREGKVGIALECPLENPNQRLKLQGITSGPLSFASRYVPEDIVLILRTLEILDRTSQRRFARYLSQVAPEQINIGEAVERWTAALDGLTYEAGCQVSALELPDKMRGVSEKAHVEAEAFLRSPAEWVDQKRKRFIPFGNRKRLWCSLRDYLKSPEFNTLFVEALAEVGVRNAERWSCRNPELRSVLDRLELPGDTWNNNDTFRDGLFMPYIENKRKTWDMPRTIREIYNLLIDDLKGTFHPEQLDVTFDFVPRMCERQMCKVCPFGGGISQLCHGKAGLLCPVPLVTCGYEHTCDPTNCSFKADSVQDFCRHWQALVAGE